MLQIDWAPKAIDDQNVNLQTELILILLRQQYKSEGSSVSN